MRLPSLGYLLVMSVPLVAAISSISGIHIGSFEYKGFIWSGTLIFGFLLTLNHMAQHRERIPFPLWIWSPWFAYVWLSLLWGGIHGRHSLQNPCQIMTPFVVGILASFYIRDTVQLSRLMKAFTFCLVFVAIVFVIFWYGPGASIQKHGTGYGPRVTGLTLVFIGALFLAGLKERTLRSVLGWATCLSIVALSGSRMATLALLLQWCIYPIYKRSRSRPLSIGIIAILAVALFYTSIFQERFFSAETGSLKQILQGDFLGSGRFQFWPVLWVQAKKHIVLGGGAGHISASAGELHLPGGYEMPSNDYLRIILDYGATGLFLFLAAIFLQLYKVRKMITDRQSKAREAFVAAYLGLIALLVTTITENTTTYVLYFMNPLFAILGAAYGVRNVTAKRILASQLPLGSPQNSRMEMEGNS